MSRSVFLFEFFMVTKLRNLRDLWNSFGELSVTYDEDLLLKNCSKSIQMLAAVLKTTK